MKGTTRIPPRPQLLSKPRKASIVVPVAAKTLATDSVDGQRARPSDVIRFDLLNVVGSRPERLARPDAESPARAATRSTAFQICACVSMGLAVIGTAACTKFFSI